MITHNKISERTEKWGIDVTVQFFNDGDYVLTKNFIFKDQKQIDTDYDARMVKAVSNVQDKLDEQSMPTEITKMEELKKYFETEDTLSKEDYLKLESTGEISISEVTK